MKFKHCSALVSLLFLAVSFACNASTPRYTITDLGASTYAFGINNSGQIVGQFGNSGSEHAFLWQSGNKIDLHTAGDTRSCASAINNNGVIVGDYLNAAGVHCIGKWENNVKTQFKEFQDAYSASATDINDSGLISVSVFHDQWLEYSSGLTTGYTWDGLSSSPLTSTMSVGAVAVNNSGTVLASDTQSFWGPGSDYYTERYNYIYKDGRRDSVNVYGICTDINDSGQIVGGYGSGGYAFLYQNQTCRLLAPLGTYVGAYSINNLGQIVGVDTTAGSTYELNVYRAVIGDINGFTDLNTLIATNSGWNLASATAINDNGWIIGQGKLNGVDHAFLLTPTPEPSSMLALAGGIGAIGFFRRKRR